MLAVKVLLSLLTVVSFVSGAFGAIENEAKVEHRSHAPLADLTTSATSAKLFNLGSLFGQTPNNGYGPSYGYRPNTYPSNGGGYYPSTSGWTGGNYPNYGGGSGYYPTTSSGYYPTTSSGYYPTTTTAGGYYPSTGGGSYPTSGGGYYPQNGGGGGYYPGTVSGTNILGGNNLGYGGYGGNGGLRQYSGYWNPEYTGTRNRGYGYYVDTDRNGLPKRQHTASGGYAGGYGVNGRDRDRVPTSYRGYD